jgi:TPP-dependent pyruvate/acetoin dehydrogenase alpha subunit
MHKDLNKEKCLDIFKQLYKTRRYSETVVELGDKGFIRGPLHPGIGMEAVVVGVLNATDNDDYIGVSHRGQAASIVRNINAGLLFAEQFGKKEGCNHGKGGTMHFNLFNEKRVFEVDSEVAGKVPIFTGVALGCKLKGLKQISVVFYGDGAMSEGWVHESMNLAKTLNLPVIFVVENNQYAVTTKVEYSCSAKNLCNRAKAYGIEAMEVDGMDVEKIYTAAKESVLKVRNGNGPINIIADTYRFCGHFTAEKILNLKYRSHEEIEMWEKRDPVITWPERLVKEKICTIEEVEAVKANAEKEIIDAVEFAKSGELPEPEDALKDMYATEYPQIPRKGWF